MKDQIKDLRESVEAAPTVYVYKLRIKDIAAHVVTQHNSREDSHLYTFERGGCPGWSWGVIGSHMVDSDVVYFSLTFTLRSIFFRPQ